MTEYEKMVAGKLYDAYDRELVEMREKTRRLVISYNSIDASQKEKRSEILRELLGSCGKNTFMHNVQFDYGVNTYIGDEFSANFNFTVLDCAPVYIGDNVMIGPNVTLATPVHPFIPRERNFKTDENGNRQLMEYAKPITIGSDVWIASNVTICGGVTIGKGSVIGAGSVVTKDIPDNVIAVGNPCRVVRKITEEDSVENKAWLY